MLPIEGELSEGLRGSLLFHSHLHAVSQSALTGNDYGSTVGDTAKELVGIVEALAKIYLHVAYLTIII